MKTLMFSILAMLSVQSAFAARIDVMSNVNKEKVAFSLTAETPKEVSALILMETGTLDKTLVQLPKGIDDEETIGLLLLSDRLLLISQNTVGGGREPHLHQYSLADKEWKLIGQIPCLSFREVTIKKSKVTVDCEGDSFTKNSAGKKSVALEVAKKDEMRISLPLLQQEKDGKKYVLTGPKGAFTGVEISKQGKDTKVVSVEELSKTQK